MIRTFLKNSTIYLGANGITKLIALAFFAYIARVLSVEQMGAYSLLNVLLTVLTLFMTAQIHDGFTRYYWDTAADDRRLFEYSTINLLFLANVVAGTGLFFLRPLVSRLLMPIPPELYAVLLALPFGSAVSALFASKLRLQDRALHAGAQMVAQLLVYVGSTLLLLRLGWDPLLAIFSGSLTQCAFAGVCYLVDVRGWRFTIALPLVRRSLVFSALIVPAAAGAYASILAGKYVVGRLLDIESVGIYEVTSRVALTAQVILAPLLQATSPIVFAHYRESGFAPHYFRLLHVHMVFALLLMVGFSLLAREVIGIIGGPQYREYGRLVLPFLMTTVFVHMTSFFVNNVHLSQKTQYLTVIEIVTGLVSATSTYGLVRFYAFPGAVAAAVASYGLRCGMYLAFANGLYPSLRIRYRLVLTYLGGSALLLVAHGQLQGLGLPLRALVAGVEAAVIVTAFLKLERVSPKQLWAFLRFG